MKYSFLFLLIIFYACSSDKKTTPENTPSSTPSLSSDQLIVKSNRLRLRAQPGIDGSVIAELSNGTKLFDLDEVSPFTTQIRLQGMDYDEPWWKVQTEDGQAGWVYGSPINFDLPDQNSTLIINKRLESLFGKSLQKQLKAYSTDFEAVEDLDAFSKLYRTGILLRDSLTVLIDERVQQYKTEDLPDLFWLKDRVPGFIPQLVAEGTNYYLFTDYKVFKNQAAQTASTTDDDFIELQFLAFPEDSIEYFFPGWMIQTWDYGGHSLLGRGVHKNIFFKMSEILSRDTMFKTELDGMKKRLVDDITITKEGYWEDKSKILAELDTIISADLTIFTPSDKVALETRRKQFEDPAANNIILNQMAGM